MGWETNVFLSIGGLVRGPVSNFAFCVSECALGKRIEGGLHQGYRYFLRIQYHVSFCMVESHCTAACVFVVDVTMIYACFQAPRSLGAGACRACAFKPAAAIFIRGQTAANHL